MMKKILKKCLDSIYSIEACLCCKQKKSNHGICQACMDHLPWIGAHCQICALPLSQAFETSCGKCIKEPPYFDTTTACFSFNPPIDAMIKGLKFNKQYYLSRLFAYCLSKKLNKIKLDAIVPIPLHPKRHVSRGFNQATCIATHLSAFTHISLKTNLLKRTKNTLSQSELDHSKRKKNIISAFTSKKEVPKRILLIDDVVTTTATVNAASLCLKKSGAHYVHVAAVARTPIN